MDTDAMKMKKRMGGDLAKWMNKCADYQGYIKQAIWQLNGLVETIQKNPMSSENEKTMAESAEHLLKKLRKVI
jgi:hypothetical protein